MDIKKHLMALKSFEDSLAQALKQLQREVGNDMAFLANFDKLSNCYKMDLRSSQLLLKAMQLTNSKDIIKVSNCRILKMHMILFSKLILTI